MKFLLGIDDEEVLPRLGSLNAEEHYAGCIEEVFRILNSSITNQAIKSRLAIERFQENMSMHPVTQFMLAEVGGTISHFFKPEGFMDLDESNISNFVSSFGIPGKGYFTVHSDASDELSSISQLKI